MLVCILVCMYKSTPSFKCIRAINLTSNLESQGHILFPIVHFVDLHINSL